MSKDYKKLGKTLAKVLRHEPTKYRITLDDDGWTDIDKLINGLNLKGFNVNLEDILIAVGLSNKKGLKFQMIII